MRLSLRSLGFAAFLLTFAALDVQAQVVDELLGHWGGRVRSRTETVLDPANTRRTQGSVPATQNDEFWVLSFQDTGGQMEGWQRYTPWAQQSQIMTGNAYGYPLRVTEVNPEGTEFEVEWSQGLLACEVEVELKDDGTKLEGRFTCRRRSTNRDILETVTRGRLELEPYRNPRHDGPPHRHGIGGASPAMR